MQVCSQFTDMFWAVFHARVFSVYRHVLSIFHASVYTIYWHVRGCIWCQDVCNFQEVNFTILDSSAQAANGRGLLSAVEGLLSSVYIPALRQLEKGWEQLYTQDGQGIRNNFLNSLDSFVTVLVGQCVDHSPPCFSTVSGFSPSTSSYTALDTVMEDFLEHILFSGIFCLRQEKTSKKPWKKETNKGKEQLVLAWLPWYQCPQRCLWFFIDNWLLWYHPPQRCWHDPHRGVDLTAMVSIPQRCWCDCHGINAFMYLCCQHVHLCRCPGEPVGQRDSEAMRGLRPEPGDHPSGLSGCGQQHRGTGEDWGVHAQLDQTDRTGQTLWLCMCIVQSLNVWAALSNRHWTDQGKKVLRLCMQMWDRLLFCFVFSL